MGNLVKSRKKVAAKDLHKTDKLVWNALKGTTKMEFNMSDVQFVAKTIGISLGRMKRSMEKLRGNGKLAINYIYKRQY